MGSRLCGCAIAAAVSLARCRLLQYIALKLNVESLLASSSASFLPSLLKGTSIVPCSRPWLVYKVDPWRTRNTFIVNSTFPMPLFYVFNQSFFVLHLYKNLLTHGLQAWARPPTVNLSDIRRLQGNTLLVKQTACLTSARVVWVTVKSFSKCWW